MHVEVQYKVYTVLLRAIQKSLYTHTRTYTHTHTHTHTHAYALTAMLTTATKYKRAAEPTQGTA